MNDQTVETENAIEISNPLEAAISAVMADIERLGKDDRNKHGGYDFTSVDDFKDHIRPLLSANNLTIQPQEKSMSFQEFTGADKNGKPIKKTVARFKFSITITHTLTDLKTLPEKITVCLPFTGPQTSGAARSYAIKEWLKGRFLLSSGDSQDEADLIEQSREGLRLSKAEARDLYKTLDVEFDKEVEGRDHDKLAEWWAGNKYRIETLPKDWFIQMRTNYATKYKELKANAELDKMTNNELDNLAEEQG